MKKKRIAMLKENNRALWHIVRFQRDRIDGLCDRVAELEESRLIQSNILAQMLHRIVGAEGRVKALEEAQAKPEPFDPLIANEAKPSMKAIRWDGLIFDPTYAVPWSPDHPEDYLFIRGQWYKII